MASNISSREKPSVESALHIINRLGERERATLEILMDKEFANEIVKRGKEIGRLKKAEKLLSLSELQREFL